VAALRATGRPVYPINAMAARYRDRHSISGRKSDHSDAVVLATMLRTDLATHRSCQPISELAQAIGVLARARQDAVWHRNRIANELRSLLREFYPGFLAAFVNRTWGLPYALARDVVLPRRFGHQDWPADARDPVHRAATHPEVITLTELLTSPDWRPFAMSASIADRDRFRAEFQRRLPPSYHEPSSGTPGSVSGTTRYPRPTHPHQPKRKEPTSDGQRDTAGRRQHEQRRRARRRHRAAAGRAAAGCRCPVWGWLAGGLLRVIDRAFEAKLAVGSRSHR
jgi:hypothetical protein